MSSQQLVDLIPKCKQQTQNWEIVQRYNAFSKTITYDALLEIIQKDNIENCRWIILYYFILLNKPGSNTELDNIKEVFNKYKNYGKVIKHIHETIDNIKKGKETIGGVMKKDKYYELLKFNKELISHIIKTKGLSVDVLKEIFVLNESSQFVVGNVNLGEIIKSIELIDLYKNIKENELKFHFDVLLRHYKDYRRDDGNEVLRFFFQKLENQYLVDEALLNLFQICVDNQKYEKLLNIAIGKKLINKSIYEKMKELDNQKQKTDFKTQLAYITIDNVNNNKFSEFLLNIYNNSEELALNVIICIFKIIDDPAEKFDSTEKLIDYIPIKFLENNINEIIKNCVNKGFKNIKDSNIFLKLIIKGFIYKLNEKKFNNFDTLMSNSNFVYYLLFDEDVSILNIMKVVSITLRNSEDFMMKVIEKYPEALKYSELRNSEDFMMKVIEKYPEALKYSELIHNEDFRKKAIQKYPELSSIISRLQRAEKEREQDGDVLESASVALKDDRGIVLEAVKQDGQALEYASAALQDDREIVLEAVKQDGQALEYASAALQDDREIVLEAVKQDGQALEYASAALQDDREIVMEAVKKDWRVLQFASAALKDDREFMLEAVKKDSRALLWASTALKDDREIMLEAVKRNWRALDKASAALQDDREIMLEAVKQDGYALAFASAALKDDREIVLEAVKRYGNALQFASAALKDNREIVLEAVKQNGWALQYASAALKDDREIVLEAVKKDGEALQFASDALKDNREIVRAAVKENDFALEYASASLQKLGKKALFNSDDEVATPPQKKND